MVAVWEFDRTVRLVRIAYCNLNVRIGRHFVFTTSSIVKYSEENDLVKIEMYPAQATLVLRPGQFYYIYHPVSLKGWENHPFTLGAYVTDCQTKIKGGKGRSKLIFYIRPYDGWTRRLRDQCRKADGVVHPTRLLEDPYGHTAPLHIFDTVLMIVGGTGIASAVPYIIDHVSRVPKVQTRMTMIRLVCCTRQRKMYCQVFCEELAQLLDNSEISTAFFWTTNTFTPGQTSPSDNRTASQENIPEKISRTGAVDATSLLVPDSTFLLVVLISVGLS